MITETAGRVASVKMGTTVATNALLERKGEPVVLVTTQGLGEQLRLGYQNRPRLFDRHIVLPEMLYARVIEADERVRAESRKVERHRLKIADPPTSVRCRIPQLCDRAWRGPGRADGRLRESSRRYV